MTGGQMAKSKTTKSGENYNKFLQKLISRYGKKKIANKVGVVPKLKMFPNLRSKTK